MQVQKIRRNKSKAYTTICNAVMKERGLSLKAKGLYALVMSLPDDWDFSIAGICAISKEQTSAIYSAIKELIEAGYCFRYQRTEKGRFASYEYYFSEKIDSTLEKLPHSDFPHTEIPHTENQHTNITKDNNKDTKESINKNNVSNETSKVDAFEVFWKTYRNGSKQAALKAWNKLTDKERATAKDKVYEYLEYCKRSGRTLKDTSSYLNQKGFNEEWLVVPDSYKPANGDNESVANFKQYMCQGHAELIYHRNPLTYEQAVKIFNKYGTRQTEWAMTKLAERNIHQYYSIEQGIEAVMSDEEYEDEEG